MRMWRKGNFLCPIYRNVNWCIHYGKQYGDSSENLKIELAYDSATSLLAIKIDICTPILIAALFTIDKTWKQPKCPLIDECIKMWYIYDGILLNHKKEWERMLPFVTRWINLQSIMLTEISQRKTNTEWFHSYVEPKKQMNKHNKTETEL